MNKTLRTLTALIATVALLTLSGCTTGMAKLAAQLKDDPATVNFRVTTIYGTAVFSRTNPGTNHNANVSPDGTISVGNIADK